MPKKKRNPLEQAGDIYKKGLEPLLEVGPQWSEQLKRLRNISINGGELNVVGQVPKVV